MEKKNGKNFIKGFLMKPIFAGVPCFVFLIILAMVGATVAWLTSSYQTGANGIQMSIQSEGNLVISDNLASLQAMSKETWQDSNVLVDWGSSTTGLIPADHYDPTDYPVVEGENRYMLVYNLNPEAVSRDTGKGDALTFAHVPDAGENIYYLDFNVLIATVGEPFVRGTDYSNLVFSIEEINPQNGTERNRAYKAASVDVYVDGDFAGTLNLDALSRISYDGIAQNKIATIPVNTGDGSGYVPILLRCYFDGALQDAEDATKNYVNSTDLSINNANIYFTISIQAE